MRRLTVLGRSVVVLAVPLWVSHASAITWEFDNDDNTQGWYAQAGGGLNTSRSRFPSEVKDGIWQIPLPQSSIELISPKIGRDSALFDRLIIRFRIVHTRPIEKGIRIAWTNSTNRDKPGDDPTPFLTKSGFLASRFAYTFPYIFTSDWQELAVEDLRTKLVETPVVGERPVLWEGELIDIRLQMALGDQGVWPDALEIDSIVLTGIEEQIQGEIPPPEVLPPSSFGELFEMPVFHALDIVGLLWGTMGDLDGDGDADLIASWSGDHTRGEGWLVAFNEGKGQLNAYHQERVTPLGNGNTSIPQVNGADLDGDGRLEFMVSIFNQSQVLCYSEDGVLELRAEFEGRSVRGFGDGDGDGDIDVWVRDANSAEVPVMLLYPNNGTGRLEAPMMMRLAPEQTHFVPIRLIPHMGLNNGNGVMWYLPKRIDEGLWVSYFNTQGEVVQKHLNFQMDPALIRYIGDFDRDGDIDLVVSDRWVQDNRIILPGLSFWFGKGNGAFDIVRWYEDDVQSLTGVGFFDLNGDEILDPVFVDGNPVQPGVLVGLGRRDALPIAEGRYPIPGRGGPVLGGDIDGDGDQDLVVLEKQFDGSGGVYILERIDSPMTAIAEEDDKAPAFFNLGANYPNPFNPQTTIPFTLPSNMKHVRLDVYNILGQPVRRLVEGALQAGHHTVVWDGKDDVGHLVSSGTYFYRIETGQWNSTSKMVKGE